jgi:ribonuclease HI
MSLFFPEGIFLKDFYNGKTLNIFSDASMIKSTKQYIGCYGSIAVTCDDIIDQHYSICSCTTTPACELRGIRSSIIFAIKYGYGFETINIFSDSQISIYSIREYMFKWKIHDGNFYTGGGTIAKNGSLIMECHRLLQHPELQDKNINLLHQLGHINTSKYNDLIKSSSEFSAANNVVGTIDLNFIRYIASYNNMVDHQSRSILRRANKRNNYEDAIEFEIDKRFIKQN